MKVFPTAFTPSGKYGKATKEGFVLIEVLVSVTVFSVGIMAVLTAVLSVLDLQKDAALRYRAGLILQEKLAETVMVSYNGQPARGISPDGVFSWTVAGELWTEAPQIPAKKTKKTKNSRERKDTGTDSLSDRIIQVVVDVSWQTGEGPRSIKATQLVHTAPQARGTP